MPQDRRQRIADAALEVLARHGARGLTHRAVDRQLGLPSGSTSYYFSKRSALLLAAAERLVALDLADLAASGGVAALVDRWLSPARRTRSLARLELLLTAARDPAFAFMHQAREQFLEHARHESDDSAALSSTGWVALVDGLLLHGLVSGKSGRNDARAVLTRLRADKPAKRR